MRKHSMASVLDQLRLLLALGRRAYKNAFHVVIADNGSYPDLYLNSHTTSGMQTMSNTATTSDTSDTDTMSDGEIARTKDESVGGEALTPGSSLPNLLNPMPTQTRSN